MGTLTLALVLAGLTGTIAASAAFTGGRMLSLTPTFLWCGTWAVCLTAYSFLPLGLQDISAATAAACVAGALAFALGNALGRGTKTPPRQLGASFENTLERRVLLATWIALSIAATLMFGLFLVQGIRDFGLSIGGFGPYLYNLRSALAQGHVPFSFHYFYFAELIVPLSVALAKYFPRAKWRLYAIAGFWLMSLTLTSGRTNAAKVLLWTGLLIFLLGGRIKLGSRQVTLLLTVVALMFTGFTFLGDQIGKSYENSGVADTLGYEPTVPRPLVLPLIYLTGPFPALDDDFALPRSPDDKGVLVRPFLQIGHVAWPDIKVPNKIQSFHSVPYAFNVTTFLGPSYTELGVLGLVLVPAAFGFLCGRTELLYLKRGSATDAVRYGFVLYSVIFSVVDVTFNNANWLIQYFLLTFLAARINRKVSSPLYAEANANRASVRV